jgi:hypothetical protein
VINYYVSGGHNVMTACRTAAGLTGVCISFFGAHLLISLGSIPAACGIIMLAGIGMATICFASTGKKND